MELDESWFFSDPAFAHFELAVLAQRDFDKARCNIGIGSVDMEVSFLDEHGRRVESHAKYSSKPEPRGLIIPAPVHDEPYALRFLESKEFKLLPKRTADLGVVVDGKAAEPLPFLLPSSVAPFTQSRISTNLLVAGLLPAHVNQPLNDKNGSDTGDHVTLNNGSLASVATENEYGRFTVQFVDPLPNPVSLHANSAHSGQFVVSSTAGMAASGSWGMEHQGHQVSFSLSDVVQDWSPPIQQPTLLALRQVRRFRRRKRDWHYSAKLQESQAGWNSTGSWTVSSD